MAYRCSNDGNWTMEFVSEGCKKLTGYEGTDLIKNKILSYTDIVHPGDREYVREIVKEALNNKTSFELIYRIKTANNDIKWVLEKGQGIYNGNCKAEPLKDLLVILPNRKKSKNQLLRQEIFILLSSMNFLH